LKYILSRNSVPTTVKYITWFVGLDSLPTSFEILYAFSSLDCASAVIYVITIPANSTAPWHRYNLI